MTTIPVSEVVRVTPGVLSASGSALNLSGLVLTLNSRPPIGTVQTFATVEAVANYFGSGSAEERNAEKYFAGFDNSNKKPGAMLFAQYPLANVSAYVRGGNMSDITLTALQAFSGTLSITIDGVLKTGSVNLSGSTSFTNAAEIIAHTLSLEGPQAATVTGSIAGTTFTAASALTGTLGPGQVLQGSGVTVDTYILSQLSGPPGGLGTYQVSVSQTAGSTAITAFAPAVNFDSISGAFTVASATAGASSTITYGSGAMATDLRLTQATAAVLSQGAVAAVPSGFMNALIQVSQKFATFMLNFNPDVSGNDIRFAFAQWNATRNNRFAFVAIDDDAAPTVTVPAVGSFAQRVLAANISGTCCNWQRVQDDPLDYGNLASFVCGAAASIDFTQTNGRVTFKFRQQSGLVPGVTDQTIFDNLKHNGYNSYGAYADGDSDFVWYADGVISGPFTWLDTYVNQIQLNSSFRSTLVNLLQSAFSIPYNAAGRATIEAALSDPINAGLNFGSYRAGVALSGTQISAVNAAAGKNISDTLTNQGWYLLIGDTSSLVRQARGSPPMTFFYVDGETVQEFELASIVLQ